MPNTKLKKTTKLKHLIQSPELSFLMEAHNGLSAKVVEEAGFAGIWGSGLSLSAAMGLRDCNEATWTQVLDVVELMADGTAIPILLDGDTGYGNFNTVRRLVKKLEQRDVAGVCMEDKIFPKTNSFINGTKQQLADLDEFSGKIKAAKDAQQDDDFCVVARVEAFIAGWGLEEALKRAEAYRKAGADAILIHSALRNPSEILMFKKEWGNRLPVVIVPTKYYATPTDVFRDQQISVVIWANHLMRAALGRMQTVAKTIFTEQNLLNVEEEVATVAEVFRIQGEDELIVAEKRYFPASGKDSKAIILAASRGKELGELTEDKPKVMVAIGGQPILARLAATLRSVQIKDINVVRGYCKEAVNLSGITYFDNDQYESSQELFSLSKALPALKGTCLIAFGDILVKKYIIEELMDADADFVVAVDTNWRDSRNRDRSAEYVKCSEPHSKRSFSNPVWLQDIFVDADRGDIQGEWIGLLKVSPAGAEFLTKHIQALALNEDVFRVLRIADLIKSIIQAGAKVRVLYQTGHWLDVNHLIDVVDAGNF